MGSDASSGPDRVELRRLATDDLTASESVALRAMLDAAFGTDEDERFGDDDWQHGLGGVHFVLEVDGRIVAHASVVERELHVGDRPPPDRLCRGGRDRAGPPGPGVRLDRHDRRHRLHPRDVRAGRPRDRPAAPSTSGSVGGRGVVRRSFGLRMDRVGRPTRKASSWSSKPQRHRRSTSVHRSVATGAPATSGNGMRGRGEVRPRCRGVVRRGRGWAGRQSTIVWLCSRMNCWT